MTSIYKNWFIHNTISHPLSEVVHWMTFWFCGDKISGWIHDVTIPVHKQGTGRG